MLLGGQTLALSGQLGQCAADAEASVAWLNHIVDVAISGCLIWIGEELGVFFLLLGEECFHVLSCIFLSLGFLGAEHCNGS